MILLDVEKMFDSINWNILFEHLKRLKFPSKLIELLRNIYENTQIYFLTTNGYSRRV